MENSRISQSIPRLAFNSKKESWDCGSFRSDFDEIFTGTQREEGDENVGNQIDRLNQVLETVLFTINKEETSSIIRADDFTVENVKIVMDSSSQTDFDLETYIKKQESRIGGLESSMNSFRNTLSLSQFTQKFEEVVASFYQQSVVQYPSFSKYLNDMLTNIKYSQLENTTTNSTFSTIDLYKRSCQNLSNHISNLTSSTISFSGTCPELELPDFVASIISEVSKIICKEKQEQLESNENKRLFNLPQKLDLACTYEEVSAAHKRLGEILVNLAASGSDSVFDLNLGLLLLSMNVSFTDEFKEKHFHVDMDSFSGTRHRASLSQSLADEKIEKNVWEMEEEILELRSKIEDLEQENLKKEEIWENMQKTAQVQIEELEKTIDNLMFQLDLKNKQMKIGKNQKTTSGFVEKLQEIREKESKLKLGYEKLDIERQKLVKQTIDFYCNKQRSLNQSTEKSETIESVCEVSIQFSVELCEKEAQTEELFEICENLDSLNQHLSENYSKLEHLEKNENSDHILENIKRIKNKMNEIHTKQALIYTEKSIDYAESKLKVIEKEIKKTMNCPKFSEKEIENLKKTNQKLAKDLADLACFLKPESMNFELEKAKLVRDRISLQKQEEKFSTKRNILKAKIEQVNIRQKKLIELEDSLNEKKIQICVQAKKQECFKQAIDEEWARIDSKRQDVLKCQKMIDDEWKTLLEQTANFESLKNEDERTSGHKYVSLNLMEKLSQIEENALKVEIQHNQLSSLKKRLEDEKSKIEEEWEKIEKEKDKIEKDKNFLSQHSQELEAQLKHLNKEKTILKENKVSLNGLGPKLRNIF